MLQSEAFHAEASLRLDYAGSMVIGFSRRHRTIYRTSRGSRGLADVQRFLAESASLFVRLRVGAARRYSGTAPSGDAAFSGRWRGHDGRGAGNLGCGRIVLRSRTRLEG